MCPPAHVAPAAEIEEYWTDEGVFKSLMEYRSGCPLPLNVTSDVNPYQSRPLDLRVGNMWYFCSGAKKDVENGFWIATGDACEIFFDSTIVGLKTTLQFYEGRPPNGQKTNWMMQEYTTIDKYNSKLDSRALCRVFLADIEVAKSPNPISDAYSCGHLSNNEQLETDMANGTGRLAVARGSLDPPRENSPDTNYVLRGDYLELNDLANPLSCSSSSADSGCLTMPSEEFFDSIALLRELEDDTTDQEMKDSSV